MDGGADEPNASNTVDKRLHITFFRRLRRVVYVLQHRGNQGATFNFGGTARAPNERTLTRIRGSSDDLKITVKFLSG